MTQLKYFYTLLLINGGIALVTAQSSILPLNCYICGINNDDDYCPSRTSRWTKKNCQSVATLSNDEALASTKTAFEDWREGNVSKSQLHCAEEESNVKGRYERINRYASRIA